MTQQQSLADAVKILDRGDPPPADAGLFGAQPNPDECRLILMPVPWDATVSAKSGTAAAPDAIRVASHKVDLQDPCFAIGAEPYRHGICLLPESKAIQDLQRTARIDAAAARSGDAEALVRVNHASRELVRIVETETAGWLAKGKLVGLVGGDHSVPLGLLRALRERNSFGILQIDAHFDLRDGYGGFDYSHASIMHHAANLRLQSFTHIGIRDFSLEERQAATKNNAKIYYDRDLQRRLLAGETWAGIVDEIVESLPESVYISFDIDGLSQSYCVATGTPVPGGLAYSQAVFLIEALMTSGKKIIGFDLCEVGCSQWDANVAACLLYKMSGATLYSQGDR